MDGNKRDNLRNAEFRSRAQNRQICARIEFLWILYDSILGEAWGYGQGNCAAVLINVFLRERL
jgi:hypothetical protein